MEYLCETDSDKSAIRLQKGETVAFKWVNAKELREMKKAEKQIKRKQEEIEFELPRLVFTISRRGARFLLMIGV